MHRILVIEEEHGLHVTKNSTIQMKKVIISKTNTGENNSGGSVSDKSAYPSAIPPSTEEMFCLIVSAIKSGVGSTTVNFRFKKGGLLEMKTTKQNKNCEGIGFFPPKA